MDIMETPQEFAFCSYTILEESPRVLIVPDAHLDPRFANNPFVLGPPHIHFYAGASLIVDGVKIGTIFVIDPQPRLDFSHEQEALLIDFADLVSDLLIQKTPSMVG